MTILRKRLHDAQNKIFAAEACLHVLEDTLSAVKQKKEALDVDSLSLKTDDAITRIQDIGNDLNILKQIILKKCNPNEDLDHLITQRGLDKNS